MMIELVMFYQNSNKCFITAEYLAIVITQLLTKYEEGVSKKNCFLMVKKPEISIEDYLKRFDRYWINQLQLSDEEKSFVYLTVMIYLDVYREITHDALHERNIHYLIASATLVAVKYHCDKGLRHKTCARIIGLTPKLVFNIELEFCLAMEYSFFLSKKTLENYQTLFASLYKKPVKKMVVSESSAEERVVPESSAFVP